MNYMCKYSCDPGLDDSSQLSQKKNACRSVYTAFTSQETFSKLLFIWGIWSIVIVFFLERLFEEGIYYVCRGDVFVVTLNVRLHDVTRDGFNVAVFTLKWLVGYTHMMSY